MMELQEFFSGNNGKRVRRPVGSPVPLYKIALFMRDLFVLIVYACKCKKQIGGNEMIVTKDTIIGDVVMQDEGIAPILMASGLHCLGCAMASGETIEEACMVHGMDCDSLVEEINNYFQSKG